MSHIFAVFTCSAITVEVTYWHALYWYKKGTMCFCVWPLNPAWTRTNVALCMCSGVPPWTTCLSFINLVLYVHVRPSIGTPWWWHCWRQLHVICPRILMVTRIQVLQTNRYTSMDKLWHYTTDHRVLLQPEFRVGVICVCITCWLHNGQVWACKIWVCRNWQIKLLSLQ